MIVHLLSFRRSNYGNSNTDSTALMLYNTISNSLILMLLSNLYIIIDLLCNSSSISRYFPASVALEVAPATLLLLLLFSLVLLQYVQCRNERERERVMQDGKWDWCVVLSILNPFGGSWLLLFVVVVDATVYWFVALQNPHFRHYWVPMLFIMSCFKSLSSYGSRLPFYFWLILATGTITKII